MTQRPVAPARTGDGHHHRARNLHPEENLGVRIEDDVLITPTGYKMLTARLPRTPDEIEKIMADGKAEREKVRQ